MCMSVCRITTTKTLICPGWETAVVPVSQPGTPVRDKRGALLSRVWQPGQKRTFCPGWTGSTFCPGWCYQPGQKGAFCPGCQTRDKRAPLLSRPCVLSWETGTTEISQPGQISVSVVVLHARPAYCCSMLDL